MVSELPLTVPGPEVTLKVTGKPELAVAESVIGGAPTVAYQPLTLTPADAEPLPVAANAVI
jgi:hypothetical protein